MAELVRAGPDLAEDGVVRWRRIDLAAGDRAALRRLAGRALGRRAAAPARAFAGCRCARSTPSRMPPPRRRIKKLRRSGAAAIPEHARGKPLELWWQDEARVGQQGTLTRIWAARGSRPRGAARPALPLGLPVRRRLPRARHWRRAGPALRQRRGDDPAPGRDQPPSRRRRACRPACSTAPAGTRPAAGCGVPRQHQPARAAALLPRTQPGRERLGVPAPEPPQQPRLRHLRRHPRRLLQGLECPHRRSRTHPLRHRPRMGTGHI